MRHHLPGLLLCASVVASAACGASAQQQDVLPQVPSAPVSPANSPTDMPAEPQGTPAQATHAPAPKVKPPHSNIPSGAGAPAAAPSVGSEPAPSDASKATPAKPAAATPSSTAAKAKSPARPTGRLATEQAAIEQLKNNHPSAAYKLLAPLLAKTPADPGLLSLTAQAAFLSQQNQTALDLFHRLFAARPEEPWRLRLNVLALEARLGKWQDFDAGVAELRAAKKAGLDPALKTVTGFYIDQFKAGSVTVSVVVLPEMASEFHTLYRFMLPREAAPKPPVAPPAQPPTIAAPGDAEPTPASTCDEDDDGDFRPHFDLESDETDQVAFGKTHPELAAKGDRRFSLDQYPTPCAQGLIRFYDGEPRYETLRAEVMGIVASAHPAKAAAAPAQPPSTPAGAKKPVEAKAKPAGKGAA